MEQSILKSVKSLLGIQPEYTAYDLDVITHINTVFSTLWQLGIGPKTGFQIEDDTATWDQFLDGDPRLNQVKSYMHLRCRLLFDPPTTSFHLDAMERQVQQHEVRMLIIFEDENWEDPDPTPDPDIFIFDGGMP